MLTNEETINIKNTIKRDPNQLEKLCFSNIWSEHCSYKSSYFLLKKLFECTNENVIIGPGDDAAIVKFNDELVLSVAMESHNHPTFIDPFNGSATGVGGIIRDILSMGTIPIAATSTLYIGDIHNEKNKWLLKNIVDGIRFYSEGINITIPNGDLYFDSSYNYNPLVNVIAIGIGKKDQIVTSKSKKEKNYLFVYGKPVEKEGLGGADFASNSMDTKLKNEKIPTGDPITERRVIKATIEAINNNLIQSCRDIGASGLAGATAELAEKGNLGVYLDLTNIHTKNNNMNICEIMLSESQERMLAEVCKADINDFLDIMFKNNIIADNIGYLINEDKYIINFHGKQVANLPLSFLVKGVIKKKLFSKRFNSNSSLNNINKKDNIKNMFLNILSSLNINSKNWLSNEFKNINNNYTFYNKLTNQKEPSILKITDNEGVIISCGCSPNLISIDPYYGSQYSIIENIMNISIKGANYLCLVNNLNFGNPNNPNQYWLLENSINGIYDLCKKLNLPVVGVNVSLYNESKEFNQEILPTTSIGIIGKISLLNQIPSSKFQNINEIIYIIGETELDFNINKSNKKIPGNIKEIINKIIDLINSNLITTSCNISRGGIGAAISSMIGNFGVFIDLSYLNKNDDDSIKKYLFSESPCRIIISTLNPLKVEEKLFGLKYQKIGYTINEKCIDININNKKIALITKEELFNSLTSIDKTINS